MSDQMAKDQKFHYRTFTGFFYEACLPVACLMGLTVNVIERIVNHQMNSYPTWIMSVVAAIFSVLAWRGIFSGVTVQGDEISNRGLVRTRTFLLKNVNNVNTSGLVAPFAGPNLFRNDVGAQVTIKGGIEVNCPAIYGSSKKVDKIVSEIRQHVKNAKKRKPPEIILV